MPLVKSVLSWNCFLWAWLVRPLTHTFPLGLPLCPQASLSQPLGPDGGRLAAGASPDLCTHPRGQLQDKARPHHPAQVGHRAGANECLGNEGSGESEWIVEEEGLAPLPALPCHPIS